jgi:H+/Cl- antiporter ClcA
MGEGQFLDVNSISGNVHGIVLGFLVCFVGWHLDEMAHWLWQQFGNELIVSPGKEAWHRIVSTTIGVILIVSAFLQLIFLIRRYRRKVKEDEIEQLRKFHDSGK